MSPERSERAMLGMASFDAQDGMPAHTAYRPTALQPYRPYLPPCPDPPRATVHKFGGASLADSTAVRHAVEIVRRHRAEPTVVVVSAMAGTTDALLEVAQQAGSGESRTVASLIARLRARHVEVARSLLPGGRLRADVLLYVSDLFAELEALAQGLRLLRELTPRTTDYLVSRGERLSARLVAAALEAGGTSTSWMRWTWCTPMPTSVRRRGLPARTARFIGSSPRCSARCRAGGPGLLRRDAQARSPRWVAAAPISPPRCSHEAWAPRASPSGRTCRSAHRRSAGGA